MRATKDQRLIRMGGNLLLAGAVFVLAGRPDGLIWAEVPPGRDEGKKQSEKPVSETEEQWRPRLTTVPPGEFPMLPTCTLCYKLSWNGLVKAGQAEIEIQSTDESGRRLPLINVSADTRSTGAARLIWPYEALNRCRIQSSNLLPVSVEQVEEDRREINTYKTRFTNGLVYSEWVTEPKNPDEAREDRVRTFEFDTIYDLVSSVLYLRSMPLEEVGDTVTVVAFPFRDPYLVTVKLLQREKHKFRGKMVDAIKFDVGIDKILKDGTTRPISNKFKSAQFWVSDDALRLPLELRAEVFVGSIRVTLTEHAAGVAGALSDASETPGAGASGDGGAKEGLLPSAARRARGFFDRFK